MGVSGSNVGASLQTNEPTVDGTSSSTIWYGWTPPFDGYITVSLNGSSIDTVLGVYTSYDFTVANAQLVRG